MNNARNPLIVIALIIAALAGISIPFLPRMAIRMFEEAYKLDVRYGELKKASPKEMVFTGLVVTDRGTGIGVSAERAIVNPVWNGLDPGKTMLVFDFSNVRFVRKAVEKAASYNSLDGLVALPFSSNLTYRKLSGKVGSRQGDVTVKDLLAAGDDMKLSFDGTVTADGRIDAAIKIFLAESLTKQVPAELTGMALNDEGGGWKSLSVKLEGDYGSPRIQLSSKLFRLRIGVKPE